MSVILERTISAVIDKRIVLSNSQFARPLPFGTTWNELRIGIRVHMRDTGANLASTPRFWLGACSGSTNLIGDASTDNFVGMVSNTTSWVRTATEYQAVAYHAAKRVGTTTTIGSSIGGGTDIGNGAALNTADRVIMVVQILKGSPNYSVRNFTWTTGAVADQSLITFLAQMELVTPALTGHTFQAYQTIAADETGGSFDHLNISWDRTTPEIEICDLAVARFS